MRPWTNDDIRGTIISKEEWGEMLDCDKEGCNPKHDDHGYIFRITIVRPLDSECVINNHAATIVRRTVTYSPWEKVTIGRGVVGCTGRLGRSGSYLTKE